MNKLIIYLFIILSVVFYFSCSVNNYSKERLLTGEKYLTDDNFIKYIKARDKHISDEFFLYNLSYFTILYPTDDLPSGETEYLFIPKLKDSRSYYELYRYSDYSEVIRLENITDLEFETINRSLNDIRNDTTADCYRAHENSMSYGFTFYFNINDINKIISTPMLLDTHMIYRKKYLCLQSYLNSILFMRELDYYGNRRFKE